MSLHGCIRNISRCRRSGRVPAEWAESPPCKTRDEGRKEGEKIRVEVSDLHPAGEAEVRFLPWGNQLGQKEASEAVRVKQVILDSLDGVRNYTNNLYCGPTYPR